MRKRETSGDVEENKNEKIEARSTPRGELVARMRRRRRKKARSSVGTCALSKLSSRHKLLVSDRLPTSQYWLCRAASLGRDSNRQQRIFGGWLRLFWKSSK